MPLSTIVERSSGSAARLGLLLAVALMALWGTAPHAIAPAGAAPPAYRGAPYPVAAPTRTPTPTAALSATPTRTPTPAPTLTPTLLGYFAPDVIEMQAPPTERRPSTHTPLPPGSLPSATPLPEPPAPDQVTRLDRTATLGVVLLAAGGGLLLIALGLLLRQRS